MNVNTELFAHLFYQDTSYAISLIRFNPEVVMNPALNGQWKHSLRVYIKYILKLKL